MSLNIRLLDAQDQGDTFRMSLSVGDIRVRSSPGSIGDNFRDLKANRYFLAKRQLAKLFAGEEPLLNLSYDDDITVTAYLYKKMERGSERINGKFQLVQALSHIDKVLKSLELELDSKHWDIKALVGQVEEDISHGVYSIYLDESASAGDYGDSALI